MSLSSLNYKQLQLLHRNYRCRIKKGRVAKEMMRRKDNHQIVKFL